MAGDKSIGDIMSAYGARGFALIRLDRLEEAGEGRADGRGASVTLSKPNWLFP